MADRSYHHQRGSSNQQLLPSEPGDHDDRASEQHEQDSEVVSLEKDVRRSWYTRQSGRLLPFMRLWWFEVLGMITSVSALLAIFGILFAYDDKALSKWNAVLRPNTIVAVLSTLSKSAMLMVVGQCIGQLKWVYFAQRPHTLRDIEIFDDASRGPLGSAKLLVHINWTALLASLGAIITLLSLAMDPFVQQVISYDAVTFNDLHSNASLSTARVYDTGMGYQTRDVLAMKGASTLSLMPVGGSDANLAGVIYKGVFGDVYQPSIDCTSGNCSWPSFESLGICSSCMDVTAASKTNCSYHEEPPERTCLTRSPLGVGVDSRYNCEGGIAWRGTLWNASVDIDSNISRPNQLLAKDGSIAIIATARFIELDEADSEGCEQVDVDVEDMIECTLKLCAKTYGGTIVQNGLPSDIPVKTEALDFIEFETCNDIFDRARSAFYLTTWLKHSENQTDEEYRVIKAGFRRHELPEFDCPMRKTDDDTLFSPEEYKQAEALAAKFQQAPTAFLVNDRNIEDIQSSIAYIFKGGLTRHFVVGEDSTKLALSAAQNNSEFDQLMDRVATGMTNYIRVGPNSTQVNGTVHRTEIRITVHWQWMTLPGAIVSFSIALLSISIIFSYEKHRTIWKSSLLASLFHGLQGWTNDELDVLEMKDMDLRAKKMRASLKPGLNGNVQLIKHE